MNIIQKRLTWRGHSLGNWVWDGILHGGRGH